VWLLGLALGLLVLGIALVWLATTRETYAGTNSVVVRSVAAQAGPGEALCVPGVDIPDHTGAVRFAAFWRGERRPGFDLRLRAGATTRTATVPRVPGASPVIGARVDIPVRPVELDSESRSGRVCVTPRGASAEFGGMLELPGDQQAPTVAGEPLAARIAIWFLPPEGEERSLLSLLPRMAERAALFRPDPIGGWTYAGLALLLWPLLAYGALRLVATRVAGKVGGARTAALVGLLTFGVAGGWALVTPPFDAPDEPEHFAYAESLAVSGKAPESSPGQLPAYSTRATLALDAVRVYSHVEQLEGRPPWDEQAEARWQAAMDRSPGTQSNGGGYLASTSTHGPAYYALTVPAHAAADDPFSQLFLMRLISALLSACTAALAFLTVRELVPRHEWAAVIAGLVVAFQPMFGFMSGALNNDNGVNAAAALMIFLLVRGLRRGLTWPLGLALGATLVVLPLMKGTGYALYPAAVVGVAGMLWRRHARSDLAGYGALAGSAAALYVLWASIAESFGRTTFTTPGGASPAGSGGIGHKVVLHMSGYLSYLWQVFLPPLPFMTDLHRRSWPFYEIYIERGWAAFGWYTFVFPDWVYAVIVAGVIGAFLLCGVTAWRERIAVRARGWEIAVLATALVGVIAGVEAAYFSTQPVEILPEQGRYAFTAMVPFAAVAVGACFAFGRGTARFVAAGLASVMLGLAFCGQLLGFTSFYA
jgi:4-amino-4-deoxy-L-arabinose transferase-like glycosyltransferase